MTQKICNALDLMRNSTCEVPFIAFYRKEEVMPELNIHDLWKIYHWDEKVGAVPYSQKSTSCYFANPGSA